MTFSHEAMLQYLESGKFSCLGVARSLIPSLPKDSLAYYCQICVVDIYGWPLPAGCCMDQIRVFIAPCYDRNEMEKQFFPYEMRYGHSLKVHKARSWDLVLPNRYENELYETWTNPFRSLNGLQQWHVIWFRQHPGSPNRRNI